MVIFLISFIYILFMYIIKYQECYIIVLENLCLLVTVIISWLKVICFDPVILHTKPWGTDAVDKNF